MTKITDNLNSNKNREYEFDVLGRLVTAKGGPTGNLWYQTYQYDRYGNREDVTASGVAADGTTPIPMDGIPDLAYDHNTNRIATTGYQYDVNGNQTRTLAEDGVTWVKYEYDSANRLWWVKKDDGTQLQRFGFGATNARFQSFDAQANQWTLYAATGGTVLAEYTELTPSTPTWTKGYTYLGDRLLSTGTPNGQGGETSEFNHPDKLGTRAVTNSAGSSYDQANLPFGIALNAESTLTANNKRFTSYDRSVKTGLDYAVNRTYDSKLGRFTQVDPIGLEASNLESPQTLNLYQYCGNDPINNTDPDGLFWGAIGRFFSAIGRAINKILGHIAVQIAIIALAAVVTLGTSLIPMLSVLMPTFVVPTWFTIATYVSTGLAWASKIGSALELGGLLFQGKFKELGKIVGLAFVGALVGIVEDSIVNGAFEGIKNGGGLFSGAWKGFKNGLKNVWAALARFGSKKWWEGFIPVYGFFCAPGWGVGNATTNETPVDGRDSACKKHDSDLQRFKAGNPSSTTVTRIDLDLIKGVLRSTSRPRFTDIAFGSGGRIGDRYGFTVPFAFGIRIAANGGK